MNTPAPWLIADDEQKTSTEEIQANARLIAAAPDMLDVLQTIRSMKELQLPAALWIKIMDVISKAKGV